jgi:SAM-dependent methyltransferase
MLKSFFTNMYASAADLNRRNILALTRNAPSGGRLLDLGCDDGGWSQRLAFESRAGSIEGVEIVPEAADLAEARGIKVARLNLNHPLEELESERYDLVHANQVIEHVTNVDTFVSEVYRLLKPGGYAVISTENGSSWHNVFAAILGWQIFSLTNVSGKMAGLGNPCAIQRGNQPFSATWTHKTIFNYRGLIEMFEVHGFREVTVKGAGYFPFPAVLGRVDARHSAFITVGARKP